MTFYRCDMCKEEKNVYSLRTKFIGCPPKINGSLDFWKEEGTEIDYDICQECFNTLWKMLEKK